MELTIGGWKFCLFGFENVLVYCFYFLKFLSCYVHILLV